MFRAQGLGFRVQVSGLGSWVESRDFSHEQHGPCRKHRMVRAAAVLTRVVVIFPSGFCFWGLHP